MKNRETSWISKSSDNIEYYYHPFFDNYTFYNPDRKTSVFLYPEDKPLSTILSKQSEECFCAFCLGRVIESTPEKMRILKKNNTILYHKFPHISEIPSDDEYVLFRRQANLFEILGFNYWHHKYDFVADTQDIEKIEQDFANTETKAFYLNLLSIKLSRLNQSIHDLSLKQQKESCQYFYSGFHELITSGSHYMPHAKNTSELFHSGVISWEDHRVSFQYIAQLIQDFHKKNPFITFVSVFQNWLSQAGASFTHWHKQIIGLDYWGRPLEREALLYKKNPKIYTEFALGIAEQEDFVIADNKHAIAYTEIGSKNGYIVICSKSKNLRPYEHTHEEINSMSDLTHAILTCLSPFTPYNEEWFYTPFNTKDFKTPWRILVNLRTNTSAGLECISQIEVNSISMRDITKLFRETLEKNQQKLAPNITIHTKKKKFGDILNYYK